MYLTVTIYVWFYICHEWLDIDGLVQDCSISIANALEILRIQLEIQHAVYHSAIISLWVVITIKQLTNDQKRTKEKQNSCITEIYFRSATNRRKLNGSWNFPCHSPVIPWASVHWLVQCTLECHWNATGWPSVHWDTTGPPSEYLQGTLEHHWKNLVETAHTGMPLEKL